MLKYYKIFLFSVVVIILCIVSVVFVGYRRILNKHEGITSSIQSKANISIGRIHQTATRNGITEWSLDAGSAHYIDAKKQAVLQDISVTFFLKDGKKIYLTANKGNLKTDSNDIEVTDNVVVKNVSYKLKTEKLYYKHDKHIIFSKVPVEITGDSFNIVADSMSFDLNTSKTLLEGKVEGTFSGNITL